MKISEKRFAHQPVQERARSLRLQPANDLARRRREFRLSPQRRLDGLQTRHCHRVGTAFSISMTTATAPRAPQRDRDKVGVDRHLMPLAPAKKARHVAALVITASESVRRGQRHQPTTRPSTWDRCPCSPASFSLMLSSPTRLLVNSHLTSRMSSSSRAPRAAPTRRCCHANLNWRSPEVPAGAHAAVAARHVRNASSRRMRRVRRDVRWR
jgi:hypothetical protein